MKYTLQDSWAFGSGPVIDSRISVEITDYNRKTVGPARDLLDRLDREVKAWRTEQANLKSDTPAGSADQAMHEAVGAAIKELLDAIDELGRSRYDASSEDDRLHRAVYAAADKLRGGTQVATERPTAWRPMATCPRDADGRLTERVWIAYEANGSYCWPQGVALHPRSDIQSRRFGWLPGHLAKVDLPPVEVTP